MGLRWIKIGCLTSLIAATASPTVAAPSAIPAPVGRAARIVAGKPVAQREAAVGRLRTAIATPIAACPGARARAAVLKMAHQGIANHAGRPDGDQGIGQDTAHD